MDSGALLFAMRNRGYCPPRLDTRWDDTSRHSRRLGINFLPHPGIGMKLPLFAILFLATMVIPERVAGYGVLSHEELIDVAWDSDIKPALHKRYPLATEEELRKAHAYVYGGCIIQDLGYYPLGNHQFTNLLHYVRSGDFVARILRDAHTLNEYAFALGALSHYAADSWGHESVNVGVAIEYPKLSARYGRIVTYEDNPEAHLKTEFSFDVVQVAKRRYISKQYHDFIGFEVAEDLLKRAFQDTYGIGLDDLLHFDEVTIGTYRFGVSRVIPEMTQVALATRKDKITHEKRDLARAEFLYHLSRADYERDFGAKYRKPGIFARILAWILRLLPKFGTFRALAYRDPTAQTEDLYFRSFDRVVTEYHRLVEKVNAGDLSFPNRNLDTGKLTQPGQYSLADRTYSELVRRLGHQHFAHVTPALKASLLEFFSSGPAERGRNKKEWQQTDAALAQLRDFKPVQPTPTN